jgi:hypothetical protein
MGWWQRGSGVIGDSVADYMESLKDAIGGIPWQAPADIPAEVRERIACFYHQGLGREPTEDDLKALLGFTKVGQ